MKDSKNLYTDRLELRIPTMKEQHRLWEILINKDVNQYYFPTPDRIFANNNLSIDNVKDLQKARKIFIEQLSDWNIQKKFYEKKIDNIQAQEDSQKYTWSIFLKGTNIVIGQITCQPKNNELENIRDVGWFIDPNYQGQGYATEAAVTVLDFMFNEVGITGIQTSAAEINPSSWKIMEKLGFKFSGTKKSSYFSHGEILSFKIYYVNKELFLNRSSNSKINRY